MGGGYVLGMAVLYSKSYNMGIGATMAAAQYSRIDFETDNLYKMLDSCYKSNSRRRYKCAHQAVHYAIKKGTLVKQPCSVCGSLKSEAHHEDYSKPLDVTWLCHKHHMHLHARIERIKKFFKHVLHTEL